VGQRPLLLLYPLGQCLSNGPSPVGILHRRRQQPGTWHGAVVGKDVGDHVQLGPVGLNEISGGGEHGGRPGRRRLSNVVHPTSPLRQFWKVTSLSELDLLVAGLLSCCCHADASSSSLKAQYVYCIQWVCFNVNYFL